MTHLQFARAETCLRVQSSRGLRRSHSRCHASVGQCPGPVNGWEQLHFGDPLVASASQDNDLDGANNLAEQGAGTDPNSSASVLKFTRISRDGGTLNLQWQGGTAVRQVIQTSASLAGVWVNLHTNKPPTAVTNSLAIPSPVPGPAYYRIQAGP